MALPGITNGNEFYSAHYLESVLTGDIKKVRERWAEDARAQLKADPSADVFTPEAAFKALRKPWQKLREAELGISGDPAERLRLQRELFFQPLCEALGYPYAPKAEPVLIGAEAYQIPLLGEVANAKGEPLLWLVECFNPSDEPGDPLELPIATSWACQIDDPSLGLVLEGETWEELISERVFGQEVPPRWVLAMSRDQLLLIDRQKWAASRLLRFELDTLLGDNNPDALLAAATLLHREHTCPSGGGTPLLDELDENSHKHAYEVSGDLKYALRRSIELLGNEAIHWRRSRNEGVFKGKTDADQLTLECLRYMYRLLFLFYIESRPDLGYAPMGSDVYRLGYSLESLRDMDTAELSSEQDKESTYISDSLDRLFQMIWEGYPKRDDEVAQLPLADAEETLHDSFRLTPLKAHLFDPERMPRLSRVRFRNVVLREVIELMSLGHPERREKRKGGFGRVSYSQLGINQLGAVYEALLSFRGFFAEEDLYEVQPAPKKSKATASDEDDDEGFDEDDDGDDTSKASGQAHDELEVGHFVTAEQLKAYKADEIVPDPGTGKPKCHPKGSFIYRLAGRDREKSASYYTPESLTQCLVKYALKELLPGKSAADILQLKVCEPAMGSAAFLNEVVNQLAQTYLELRQQETGKSIPHEQFATELQKVKMRLADQNVFGVDLNPVAVELAEVSLWLNSIFTPEKGRAFVPWFSQQLVCGNSLIGARRQIYRVSQLPIEEVVPSKGRSAKQKTKVIKPSKVWHEQAPEELAWDADLAKDAIFHFLLPDPGMAAYADKVIKELDPEAIERCKRWNKAFVDDAFTEAQIAHLLRLSQLVDALWKDWAEQQTQLRQRTTDPLPVWGDPTRIIQGDWTPLRLKDRIQEQEVLGLDVANTNARLRLKWAIDYWCALWFWPIRQAESLPSRDTWLLELSMILGDLEQGVAPELGQGNLFADTQPKQLAVDFSDRHGFVDVQKLKAEFERLRQVEMVHDRIRPLHWDLEFADLLKRGGFDLIVGNPPWIPARSSLSDIASDIDPIFSVRPLSAALAETKILSELGKFNDDEKMVIPLSGSESERNFYSASQNYPATARAKPNLYKLFLEQSQRLRRNKSALGLLHPEGLFIEKEAVGLRDKLYSSLKQLFIFRNTLFLFADIEDSRIYAISVFGEKVTGPSFNMIAGLIHPDTVDGCFVLQRVGSADAMGSSNLEWKKQLRAPLAERILTIDQQALGLFARLLGESSQGSATGRLIFLTSTRQYHLLQALDQVEDRIGDVLTNSSSGLNERFAQRDGLIEESIGFPDSIASLVLAGPHVFAGNGLAKTPNRVCNSTNAYTALDFTLLPSGYLPRSCFRPANSFDKGELLSINDFRLVLKRRLDSQTERTLQAAIVPPGPLLTNTLTFATGKTLADLIYALGILSSIPFDAYVKLSGLNDIYASHLNSLPLPLSTGPVQSEIFSRACRLAFASPLMEEACQSNENIQECIESPRYCSIQSMESLTRLELLALRHNYSFLARRRDLVDIDVLTCMLLGLDLGDLIYIYQSLFHRLRRAEAETWYDQKGRIVFTSSKGLAGVGFPRKGRGRGANKESGWEDIFDMASGSVSRTIVDDTLPSGPVERTITYEAPFYRCDRVEDYKAAWAFFEKEGIDA
jgi:methylase of polypeptide subunit release factors